MENASKALIIAGAILLAIVIISLGLIVVNNTRNTVDTSNLNEQEIQSFNSKFTAYEGSNVGGSRVNTLIQQVIATNQALVNDGKDTYCCLSIDSTGTLRGKIGASTVNEWNLTDCETRCANNTFANGAPGAATSVKVGKNYQVNIEYKNGLVKLIRVGE